MYIMSKEKKHEAPKGAQSNYPGQEHESVRRGTQARLAEKVVDAAANKDAHQNAKNNRFAVTGECSEAPTVADVQ
jgi:hypothetical protein